MGNPLLTKNWVAEAAVAPYRFVKHGTVAGQVLQGAAATDAIFGVSDELGAAITARVDVIEFGIADVEYGGNVAVGDPLTADADGKAVKADPASGVNNRIGGFARVAGASGDIGSVNLAPGYVQGAGL